MNGEQSTQQTDTTTSTVEISDRDLFHLIFGLMMLLPGGGWLRGFIAGYPGTRSEAVAQLAASGTVIPAAMTLTGLLFFGLGVIPPLGRYLGIALYRLAD